MKLLLGDCLEKLKELDDDSVDSIVTDPPYGLSFMGKDWDHIKATKETKSQVVKGLGAGMKMTTLADNIEFEKWVTEWSMECYRVLKPGGYMLAFGGSRMYHRLASGVENAGFEIRDQMMWVYGSGFPKSMNLGHKIDEYQGWGTALKPAHEPIVMGRKPISEKTVVDNVLKWGTGGINIDGCRVEGKPRTSHKDGNKVGNYQSEKKYGQIADGAVCDGAEGRFPANIIFDEEAGKMLPDAGQGGYGEETTSSASRFFYCPKTSKSDRSEGNIHPTVKPTDLMAYLIRLVTPKGGVVLDPFMGSGSTGKAAVREGMDFIGIERETEYFEIAEARINWEINKPTSKPSKTKKVEVEKKVEEKVNQFFG
jgi:site-specific DNA-methyltransferase (adenine-specific)